MLLTGASISIAAKNECIKHIFQFSNEHKGRVVRKHQAVFSNPKYKTRRHQLVYLRNCGPAPGVSKRVFFPRNVWHLFVAGKIATARNLEPVPDAVHHVNLVNRVYILNR